jgi:hypothetical protein
MNIIKLIKKAIHDYKNPSDSKLFNKALSLYSLYVSNNIRYHVVYKHKMYGTQQAIVIRDKIFNMLCSIPDMPVGAERRKKIVEMVALFKQYNR